MDQALRNSLNRFSKSDQRTAVECFFRLHDRVRTNDELYEAATLINRGHGSDDAYAYFVNWLILQGRDVFERAVENPDSLAKVDVVLRSANDKNFRAQSEDFFVFFERAPENITESISQDANLRHGSNAKRDLVALQKLFPAASGGASEVLTAATLITTLNTSFGLLRLNEFFDHPKRGKLKVLAITAVGDGAFVKVQSTDGDEAIIFVETKP